jgi:bifunctional UDP-N-acetylglucosamine pyrophosphorylase/glucosamine-1-phosphate N-acetyltransferase/UDP-N-acetylglucosamine pyrophosphorylase
MNRTTAIVLAAGKGTRMKSDLPKVLFPVLGRPMIHWVLDALEKAGAERPVVVVGYQADRVREELRDRDVRFALQEHQLGTGHAVQSAMPQLGADENPVFVLAGDSPLVQPSSLRRLRERMGAVPQGLLLGTLTSDRPDGLGRIVRDESGRFLGIVEHKDATAAQLQVRGRRLAGSVGSARESESAGRILPDRLCCDSPLAGATGGGLAGTGSL